MRHSLRLRALALVFLFNSAVFAALGFVLLRFQAEESRRAEELWTEDLVTTIRSTIEPAGMKVANILRWPHWRLIGDAILVDDKLEAALTGAMVASGIELNPVGVAERPADFDRESALIAIHRAIREGRPVAALGGRAVPILGPEESRVWGGVWYRVKERRDADYGGVLLRMLPWFALSTVLLTTVTFLALRRLVLDPVAQLAEGARRMRSGDLAVELDVPTRRDELAELVRSFNEMSHTVAGFNQRLSEEVRTATEQARAAQAAAMRERRLAAMGELAAGIAHEINNPLGGLQNAVDDLKRPDLAAERRRQYLELLARGLTRIGETVNRLRRFTPRDAPFETVELPAVIEDAVELVAHRARRAGVALVLRQENAAESSGGAIAVQGSRTEIGQALLNLLVNALDALEAGGTRDPRGPRVEIRVDSDADELRLVVRDNGPGVDAHELQRVGDLFYTTKDVGRGTGLGLALVHSALQRHGGHVRITSERGRYFQVELAFPRRRPQPPAAEAGRPA